MREMKIKIETESHRIDERLEKIMEPLKKLQQENNLEITLVEVFVKNTTL